MKIEKEFILREIAGDYVLVPVGKTALTFNGMITVNEVGAFLWQNLQSETTMEQLIEAMLDEYEVDEDTARADVEAYIELLREHKILE